MKIISNVSKDFLRYSANDIFLTACAAVEILFMDKLDKVKVLSQKKLDDFYKYWNKYKRVRDFRHAEYTRREFTVITQGSVSESHHITQLLMRWKELSEAIELINLDIKEINDILRIDSEQKEIITRKFEAVVNILRKTEKMKCIRQISLLAKVDGVDDVDQMDKLDDLF